MFCANIKKKQVEKYFLRFVWVVKKCQFMEGEKNFLFAAYACSGKVSTKFKPL